VPWAWYPAAYSVLIDLLLDETRGPASVRDMFTQEDIDAVLNSAQDAVNALVTEVAPLPPPPAAPPTAPPPVRPVNASRDGTATHPSSGSLAPATIARILRLRVPVVVRLAERRMPLQDVLRIVPGTMLEFDRTVDNELDLMVKNHQIGGGVAVKVDEHFGLRITFVGDVKQRLQSLAR
jgi:flagellar motor switch protein FliN